MPIDCVRVQPPGRTRRAHAAAALSLLAWCSVGTLHAEETPPGVQQLMPRNGIPSIFEPVFVSADEATIPDNAWVLGVAIEGHARAYSLNLLNHHEIVNDRVGEQAYAAVW